MKTRLLFLMVVLAVFTRCNKSGVTPTQSTGSGKATWTIGNKNHSTNNALLHDGLLSATDPANGDILVVTGGDNPFVTSTDSCMVVHSGQTYIYPKSIFVQASLNNDQYVSMYRADQRYAQVNVVDGKISITIPQIWLFRLTGSNPGDSLLFSGVISQ